MRLWDLFLNHRGRIVHKWKHYFPVYERHFGHLRNRPCLFVEIGCGEGGSLQLWRKYLGPYATIVGIDNRPECSAYEQDEIHIRIGNQSDPEFLDKILREFGLPTVVLDDGSHRMGDISATFDYLYPRLGSGAIYLVEDLHTAYWPEYEGGLAAPGSFIERCKGLIDELNADHTRGALAPTSFTGNTLSMHFYDSIAVFEKGTLINKSAPRIGRQSPDDVEPAELPGTATSSATATIRPKDAARGNASRELYLELLIKCLANVIYGDPPNSPGHPPEFDRGLREVGKDWPTQAHSMAGLVRLRNLKTLVQRTLDEGIPGDYIETGVWRGGCCILMRAVLAANGIAERKVYAADSFAGLPPPKPELYLSDAGDVLHQYSQLAVSVEEVCRNFAAYGLLDDNVVFLPGLFQHTLPELKAGPFSLIRLDGDMYESTIVALTSLYPRLSPGGFIIVDDYGAIEGCRAAVNDYRRDNNITSDIHSIDWTGIWWQKPLE